MTKLSKQSQIEMVQCVDKLIKQGIYNFGINNTKLIASYLISHGCRIYIGSRKRKFINEVKLNETENETTYM